ncbi:MAG: hypothetical protein QM820_48850 [Minicystis sp.]
MIKEGSFIPEEAEAARSSRQSSALSAINASLKSGVLSDPAKRKDRKLVRQELDKAWGLSAGTIALMDQVFGATVSRTIIDASTKLPANSGMMLPKDILVGHNITLADAIGQPVSSTNILQRKGKYAWNEVSYPTTATARRDVLRRMQKAMHSGMPVILSWFVDFNAMDKMNQFLAPPAAPGHQGGHMTVVEDYQVSNVPGFGTLAAGTVITDPKALTAALDPKATIDFLRIKNSWGTSLAPANASTDLRGYYDLYMKYLDAQLVKCTESNGDKCGTKTNVPGLTALILPPDAFVTDAVVKEGICSADLCVAGPALSATTCSANPDKQACVDSDLRAGLVLLQERVGRAVREGSDRGLRLHLPLSRSRHRVCQLRYRAGTPPARFASSIQLSGAPQDSQAMSVSRSALGSAVPSAGGILPSSTSLCASPAKVAMPS